MTAQIPDILLYQGERLPLLSNPLEDYYRGRPRPSFHSPNTANWRGYVATWEIEQDQLFLTGLQAWIREAGQPSACEAGLQELFPGQPGRIPATWFSGQLRIPRGERLHYVHMGYESTYRQELLLSVEAGKVVRSDLIDRSKGSSQGPEAERSADSVPGTLQAGETIQVRVIPIPGCLQVLFGVFTLGVFPLVVFLQERRWPETLDEQGLVTRSRKRIAWGEFTRVEKVITDVNGTITERYDLHSPAGTVPVVAYRLQDGEQVLAYIWERLPQEAWGSG